MRYTHLGDNDRRRIERLLGSGRSIRYIARQLERSPNTIGEEIAANSVKGSYNAKKAHHKAVQRRKKSKIQCMKAATHKELKEYVTRQISDEQSPEAISGRLKHVEKDLPHASTKAIYKFIHSPHGRKIEKHLYSKAVKKKSGPKRGKSVFIDGRTMIDRRPKRIEKRKEFGHFGGDFIESGREGTGSLLVLAERKTRYPFVVYTESKKTEHVNRLIAETLKGIPVLSVTLDNDLSFQKHKELSEIVGAVIFFCHAFHSWEKGTVENRNKAIRRYVPKRSDISQFKDVVAEIETKLRTRFMKCLGFKTPQECFDAEMEKQKKPHERGILGSKALAVRVNTKCPA